MSKPILITGVTGNQGGAVLDAMIKLNDKSFTLIALTRNKTSPASQNIAKKSSSVQILQGDMNEPALIFKAAQQLTGKPIWGIFMVQVCVPSMVSSVLTSPSLS